MMQKKIQVKTTMHFNTRTELRKLTNLSKLNRHSVYWKCQQTWEYKNKISRAIFQSCFRTQEIADTVETWGLSHRVKVKILQFHIKCWIENFGEQYLLKWGTIFRRGNFKCSEKLFWQSISHSNSDVLFKVCKNYHSGLRKYLMPALLQLYNYTVHKVVRWW